MLVSLPLIIIGVYELASFWYLPSTRIGWVLYLVAIPCLWVAFAAYGRFRYKRIEFYDDFVRMFSVGGRPTDIPYSHLDIRWEKNRNGTPIAVLSDKGSRDGRPSWQVGDIGIDQLNTTLFPWLKGKVTQST